MSTPYVQPTKTHNTRRHLAQAIIFRLVLYGVVMFIALLGVSRLLIDRYIYYPEGLHEADPQDFGLPFEDLTFAASDGVKIHAWWIYPERRPVVLFFHGNAGNISHRLDRIHSWNQLPAGFLLLDYRGYGRSAGNPSEDGLYRDADAAYRFLRDERKVEPKQMVLFGESLGGAVAIDLAAREPVAGMIVESTFTSVRELAGALMPFVPTSMIPDQFASIGKVGKLRAPSLFVHASNDEIVPFAMGRKLYEAAPATKDFLEVKGATHNDVYVVGGEAYRERLQRFLEECGEKRVR